MYYVLIPKMVVFDKAKILNTSSILIIKRGSYQKNDGGGALKWQKEKRWENGHLS